MSATEAAKTQSRRGPGRPRKRPLDAGRRNVTFRVKDETYEQITTAAAAAGRSISEEIEARIDGSFSEPDLQNRLGSIENLRLVLAIGDAISLVETVSRRKWVEDEETLAMVRVAVSSVMDLARASQAAPANDATESRAAILLSIGARYSVAKLAAGIAVMVARKKHTPDEIQAALDSCEPSPSIRPHRGRTWPRTRGFR